MNLTARALHAACYLLCVPITHTPRSAFSSAYCNVYEAHVPLGFVMALHIRVAHGTKLAFGTQNQGLVKQLL